MTRAGMPVSIAVMRILLVVVCLVAGSSSAHAQWNPDEFDCDVNADGLASYVGQTTCLSKPQPGVADFKEMILDAFPETGDLGIMRACNNGGTSEHKEGRAWDWWVLSWEADEKAMADGVLAALLETDECGNKHALARRLGIMYMVWNKRIWKAYQSSKGWQNYSGSNPHTNHVHFSFSWAGAKKQTTYWTGEGTPGSPEGLPTCTPAAVAGAEGEVFKDMPKGAFGYDAAIALAEAGITNGCKTDEPKLFCPNCPAPRYQAVVLLLRAMGADVSSPPAVPSFEDVPKSDWWYPYVEAAKKLGLTRGCGPTTFCPTQPTTRAEMAKFIVKAAGWKESAGKKTFADVPTSAWYYKSVETIKEHCVTNGCGDGVNFCPDDQLTRAQAAIFIQRAFDLNDANKCLDYCQPTLCAEGAFCEEWTTCGGFANACAETGKQSRSCFDFASCSAKSLDPTCGETSNSETQACERDTQGKVVNGWTEWSACGGFDDDCDATGRKYRTRTVCDAGAPVEDEQEQPCMRAVPEECDEPAAGGETTGDAGGDATTGGGEDTTADTAGDDGGETGPQTDGTTGTADGDEPQTTDGGDTTGAATSFGTTNTGTTNTGTTDTGQADGTPGAPPAKGGGCSAGGPSQPTGALPFVMLLLFGALRRRRPSSL